MPAPAVGSGLKQILAPHAPYSHIANVDLKLLIANVEVAYFFPGETLLAQSAEVSPHLLIVMPGQIRGLRDTDPDTVALDGGPGECVAVGATLAERPVALTYVAVGDTFCLPLPRALRRS
jgi:CBS domain-containing protein